MCIRPQKSPSSCPHLPRVSRDSWHRALGKRALAGPDSSAVAAVEVAVAAMAGAILRAGRGCGTETGGGEAAGEETVL